MGRPKGATKLLVEDSLALDLRDLARAGVFRVSIGTPCNCSWNDAGPAEIVAAYSIEMLIPHCCASPCHEFLDDQAKRAFWAA